MTQTSSELVLEHRPVVIPVAGKREVVEGVRATILENLPPGYSETMNWGMISYQIPLET